MFEAFATPLKGKLYFFLQDIQRLKFFFFFQETHSCDSDMKTQWGDLTVFSHGSSHSAGVAIFFNKFKGDVFGNYSLGKWKMDYNVSQIG